MSKYPYRITSDHPDVYAVLSGDHYRVNFPYSQEAVAAAKQALKAPTFDRQTKSWLTKKRWHASLPDQLAQIAKVILSAEQEEAAAKAEEKRRQEEANDVGRAALSEMKPYSGGITLEIGRSRVFIDTAYHEQIVSLFKSLGGKFDRDRQRWSLPLSAGTSIAAHRDQIAEWHNETVEANQARKQAKEARRANRYLERADSAPAEGAIIRRRDQWFRVDGLGKIFIGDEDTSSLGGPVGAEDEPIRYVYLVDASDDEIAAAEANERARQAQEDAAAARRDAIRQVAEGEPAPHTGVAPEGETLWTDDTHAATGLRYWIVLSDEWLYHLTYDGSDGARWGDENAGYNTRAKRVLATDSLINAIRS